MPRPSKESTAARIEALKNGADVSPYTLALTLTPAEEEFLRDRAEMHGTSIKEQVIKSVHSLGALTVSKQELGLGINEEGVVKASRGDAEIIAVTPF